MPGGPAGLRVADVAGEAAMLRAEALRQRANHLMVRAAFAGRLDQLAAPHDVLVAAALWLEHICRLPIDPPDRRDPRDRV